LAACFTVAATNTVLADPPTRVARLGYTSGAVSYSPAGENDWVEAPINIPIVTGDRLWADSGAMDELQIGSAAIRMGASTSVTMLNLDDHTAQLQLSQGSLNVRVWRLHPDDVFEVDTPNLAFSLRQPGEYRIDVDADGNATTVAVRHGQAEVDGEGAAYVVDSAQAYRFAGTGLRDYQSLSIPADDAFDHWAADRDRRLDNSASARYVSPDMIGYEDLDEHGTWRNVSGYGNVWMPSQPAESWAPYHDGHWAWVDPWGWTWVDNAPWGFAVSHYGRWINTNGAWGWVPGPIAAQPVYAPALVAFVGGNGFSVSVSGGNVAGVAWFPLAPQDVYRPSYKVSLNYFAGINASSTVVNHTNITNVYNNTNVTNITYVNRSVPGAVIAVSASAFTQSQPVSKSAIKLSKEQIDRAPVAAVAAVAPVAVSLRAAPASAHTPPAAALIRHVVVKTPPPPTPVPFAVKQAAMAAHPGKPLEPAALAAIKPPAIAQTSQIQVVHPAKAATPMSKAPASAPAEKSPVGGSAPAAPKPLVSPAEQPHPKEPPAAPAQVAKPAEKAAPDHPSPPPRPNPDATNKPVTPPPNVKPMEPEPHPFNKPEPGPQSRPNPEATNKPVTPPPNVKPMEPVPQSHPPVVHEPAPVAHEPTPVVHEAPPPHEPPKPPPHEPVKAPQPNTPPPSVVHPPKPEAAKPPPPKHEDQHAEKGEQKKSDEDKQHKE
jgi:hypothetical protein